MSDCANTARLSPDERLREIAAILADGVLRLRQRAILPPENGPQKPPLPGLEVPAETVLTVHTG